MFAPAATNAMPCDFGPHDLEVGQQLIGRLEEAASQKKLLTFNQFVSGVTFHIPGPEGMGMPAAYSIDTEILRSRDIAIIHDFSRYLAAATFRDSGVIINALLVPHRKSTRAMPQFFDWSRKIGLLSDENPKKEDEFWMRSVDAVHKRYSE